MLEVEEPLSPHGGLIDKVQDFFNTTRRIDLIPPRQ